jgi:hypothetical protein
MENYKSWKRGKVLRAYACEASGEACPPDQVFVFYCTGNSTVLITFVNNGCVNIAGDIPTERFVGYQGQWDALLGKPNFLDVAEGPLSALSKPSNTVRLDSTGQSREYFDVSGCREDRHIFGFHF